MGSILKRIAMAIPGVAFVAVLVIPSTMVMTGCDDPVSPDTVVQYDTLAGDTVTIIDSTVTFDTLTIIDSITGDTVTVIDTSVIHDTVTISDTVNYVPVVYGRVINLDNEKGSVGNLVTDHYLNGNLELANNIIFGNGGDEESAEYLMKYSEVDTAWHKDTINARVAANNFFDVDPGVTRDDWLPEAGGPAFTNSRKALPAGDDFFQTANFIGAFGTEDWASWTYTAQLISGEITDDSTTKPEVHIDEDITSDVEWSADTTYILDGFIFVEDGASLTVPASTVIKGKPGGGLNASALIVARGGQIFINGTADAPVIMTAQQDDLRYQDDMSYGTRGLWGGLIVLGKSICNRASGNEQIEGITPDDPRGTYGGTDLADNSGSITYLSLRHGGTNIGEGNEINGLTMGGVGSGTVISNVEIYNNVDDGFEWFGGSVNTNYLISVGSGDDSFDWDEGFNGKGQFWIAIQKSDAADRAIEADGCASDNRGNTQTYSKPTIYNYTLIGQGVEDGRLGNMAMKIREETGGHLCNGIITDFYGDLKTVVVQSN